MSLTFVVGSGRCGSTLLSRVLKEHPDVLGISELFAVLTVHQDDIPLGDLDGPEMWRVLSASDHYLDAMSQGSVVLPELCYPYDRGRFSPATGVPVIAHMTLPMLTDDPDALYDELAAAVSGWPRRPATEHYRALFGFLAERFGRSAVVERSGASLTRVPLLRREFPEARFVHMYRNGPDTALSMSRHPGFRLTVLVRHAVRLAGVSSRDELTPEHLPLLPPDLVAVLAPPFDPEKLARYDIPLALFGETWSAWVCQGLTDLAALPPDVRDSLRYEDLMAEPDAELTRFAEFVGVAPDPGWLATARAMLDRGRVGSASRLAPAERAELEEACAPGTEAIAKLAGAR